MNRAYKYIKWAKENPRKVGTKVKKSIARFEAMVEKCSIKGSKIYYDEEEPELVIAFAETYLKIISDGELKPLVVYPWQGFILHAIYGFKYKKDNSRVVRTAVISTAKKNGKSTFEAIPILYDLFGRVGADIYLAAMNKAQTNNVFEPIKIMLENSPELLEKVEMSSKHKSVVLLEGYGKINTLSKGSETKQGIKPSLAVVDEYYLYKNDDLLSIIKYGFRSVENPLLIIITTNGKDKNSVYYSEYDRCCKLIDGVLEDDATFFISYEIDETDKWENKSNLIKANPMLNHTLAFDKDFKSDLDEAIQKPFKRSDYKMLTCNIWVDNTSSGWITDDIYKHTFNGIMPKEEYLKTLPCTLAIDLSKIHDFTVLTQTFKDEKKYYTRHWMYIPENQIEEKIQDNNNIKYWIEQGYIKPTPGATVDYDYLIEQVKEIYSKYNCLGVAYDRWKIEEIRERLEGYVSLDFEQSLKGFSNPTKRWEKNIIDKVIVDTNPVARWMLSCATVKPDVNGNYKPLKSEGNKAHKRIDAVITSIMAHELLNLMLKSSSTGNYTREYLMNLI